MQMDRSQKRSVRCCAAHTALHDRGHGCLYQRGLSGAKMSHLSVSVSYCIDLIALLRDHHNIMGRLVHGNICLDPTPLTTTQVWYCRGSAARTPNALRCFLPSGATAGTACDQPVTTLTNMFCLLFV